MLGDMIVTVRTLANGTNPHYRIPLKVSVTRRLEQFHFEIALTPNTVRRAAKTDPTGGPWGRACSPKGIGIESNAAWIPAKRPKAARRAVPVGDNGAIRGSTAAITVFFVGMTPLKRVAFQRQPALD